ncbi:MAG: hypothetical protein JWN14_3348 [Chthonomonadales bacterium]|nr:hypothetical protein [Chthonomonadales bacterium]
MNAKISLDDLWNSPSPEEPVFRSDSSPALPEGARRYLDHAIASDTRLASAVRLKMHGEIKLQRWLPFTAEEVIRWDRGMIWSAAVLKNGIPIRGSDRIVDGEGSMQWKLLGIFPVMTAAGPDITRSAIGRVQVESIWLPSVLCHPEVIWTETDPSHPHACFTMLGRAAELDLAVEENGRVTTASLPRWGNPEGAAFHDVNFGGVLEAEGTFEGYTIPTRIRAGWYFGTDRFESDGEFFRATVDQAIFR